MKFFFIVYSKGWLPTSFNYHCWYFVVNRLESSQNVLQQSLNEYEKLKLSKDTLKSEMEANKKSLMDEISSLKQVCFAINTEWITLLSEAGVGT